MGPKVISIDLGGTSLKSAIVTIEGKPLVVRSVATPQKREAVLDQLALLIMECSRLDAEVRGVGIGTPGTVDLETGVVTSIGGNISNWVHTPLKDELRRRGVSLPIWVDNDANMAAWAEYTLGAGREASSVLMLTLGTGLGGAYIENGHMLRGVHQMAGELGHMILYPNGRPCVCGQSGCVERYVSGTGLSLTYENLTGTYRTGEWIMTHAQEDAFAFTALERFIDDFSWYLLSIKNIFDPEVIVLGGGLAESYALWDERLFALTSQRLNDSKTLVLRKGLFERDAGVIGAALEVVKYLND